MEKRVKVSRGQRGREGNSKKEEKKRGRGGENGRSNLRENEYPSHRGRDVFEV